MAEFAVLGFRPHTYWTAAVALGGPRDDPRVIGRWRIDFAAGDERSVYHHAAELPEAEAEARVAKTRTAVVANARRGIEASLTELRAQGVETALAVVPIGRKKPPETVAEIIRSHALMHAAEGDFYRAAVAQAAAALGLEVRRVVERDLPIMVGALLDPATASVENRLKRFGAALGPPWSQDQQLAMLAAWTALAAGD